MEFGLREWLIIIGIIVIAGILFDGWRRMRGGKGKLKFRLDRNLSNLPDDDGDPDVLSPPRVVERNQEPSLDEDDLPSMSARDVNNRRRGEPRQGDLDLVADEPVPTLLDPVAEKDDSRSASSKQSDKDLPPVEEVLVINVIARDEQGFKGPALLQNILESGLRFGEMDIFHRHESMAGNGEVLFSMANALKPGTFDLDDIEGFSTRAVSFFLSLPGPRHPKQAFDVMVAAARKLAHELNGELKDDQRSVLTAQTIEHYRQRIVEYERRLLTQKR
ncbi:MULTISPECIES: cell division protein ZipA [Pseudomonadaceae]|uniref:Cell division protein ZipA n=2 Tax=Pseudomonadaceae TaxID=135621 RepID=F6AG95_PSEF1|nr:MULTISPECIES: cell division protein ZipA [Pseudomonas]AEF22588.1 Cell division protein zipA-like protein [Pseudomonas fulva 12-X]MBV7564933.1 cell division protein ZipA [Pseudomonas sp. sia0905]GLX16328.1 cell division protein ZipA [Pseudomonas straminea]SFE33193.1 cell division protein ZipA [Pseudomonas straminea]